MQQENRFLQKLQTGESIVLGEGYIFELERRGYLQAGVFCPEVVLEHPEIVKQLYREFARCGSDVILALTYYANKAKLKMAGISEEKFEEMNKRAIVLAWEVQKEKGFEHCLVAGDISNSTDFILGNKESEAKVLDMFREQAKWAKEGGCDFILSETISSVAESLLTLKAIKEVGLPSLINMTSLTEKTQDGYTLEEAFKILKENGATVVGLNCHNGPDQILPKMARIRKVVDGPLACLPVPYRTTDKEESFWSLSESITKCGTPNGKPFPTGLDPYLLSRYEMAEFAVKAKEIGVQVIGICCGCGPHHLRALSEALGKTTIASKYSPNMAKHFALGDPKILIKENAEHGQQFKQ